MNPSKDEQRVTFAVNMAALRRDAQRWRWAKEHPGMAVYIFDIQWMEQRDFDAAIDMGMQQAHPIKPCTNCTRCLFECQNGKWQLNGQTHDCYGCDGSGIDTRCEEHREKDA